MSDQIILQNLRKSILFEKVSESLLLEIANIAKNINVDAGIKILSKGDFGDSMFIVTSGRVRVHDGDLTLNFLGPGTAFGEMAALDGAIRTASISAEIATSLIELKRKDIMKLVATHSEFAEALIHFLCQRGKHIINDITERTFVLKAFEHEMEIGRNIQSGFLPSVIPDITGWDVGAYFRAAKEVAGDFYDIFPISGSGNIALVVGDVCGKGVGAALFMALFRSLMRASILSEDFKNSEAEKEEKLELDIETILLNSMTLTNNYVANTHGDTCMFATIFVAVLNPDTGELFYVNGGHESPVVFNEEGVKLRLSHTGPAVGLFPGEKYQVLKLILEEGDALIAFTDGVIEAVNSKREQFTKERMLEIMINNENSMNLCLSTLVDEIDSFAGDAEQFDDITLLALRRL